jgi:hypothetical protein
MIEDIQSEMEAIATQEEVAAMNELEEMPENE